MGYSNYTYVGVYLEIPILTLPKKRTVLRHPDTHVIMQTKFCANTGKECYEDTIEELETTNPQPYIDSELSDLDEDTFYSPEFINCEPNHRIFLYNYGSSKYAYCQSDLFTKELGQVNVVRLINSFTEEFKDYLDYYTNLYGTVNIKYGVVTYAS